MNNKESYIEYVKNNYENEAQELLLNHIELFFNPSEITKNKYNKKEI